MFPNYLVILYYIFQAIFILVDMFLLLGGLYAFFELLHSRPKFVYDPRIPPKGRTIHAPAHSPGKEAWHKIRLKAEAGTHEGIRLAIIEADGFVDTILKERGYTGETFADRLATFNPHQTHSLNRLWDAHRLRNDIVHTHGFDVSPERARIALDSYEAFLEEINAL